jgi:GTP cyclohydrolase IA
MAAAMEAMTKQQSSMNLANMNLANINRANINLAHPNPAAAPEVSATVVRPERAEVETAVRTILRWIGDDPMRPGLIDTPKRVTDAFDEHFKGYAEDPKEILGRTFEEIDGYDAMVVLRGVPFQSHCEHHMSPMIGRAWVAYIPNGRVVGVGRLARLVDAYAKRLQIQERMTAQIANVIEDVLKPAGVAVLIKAEHHCMSTRGVQKHGTDMVTSRMFGAFLDNPMTRQEFMALVD